MNKIRQNVLPVIAAIIWGLAFSAQADCAEKGVEPFTFNASRSLIATVVVFFIAVIFSKGFKNLFKRMKKDFKPLLLGGFCTGASLFLAANFQQAAFSSETASGKVGFITVFYLMLVPIFGLFLKKKASLNVWISVLIALVGMYFLCVKGGESFSISINDLYALLCAVAFAVQILFIDYFVNFVDEIQLSFMQFFFVTVFSLIGALFFENPKISALSNCFWQIAYVGVFSSGVAYTLQILSQKGSNPTIVSLLFSLESVFSVIFGAIILGEIMAIREYIGCGIMFLAVILAQLPARSKTYNVYYNAYFRLHTFVLHLFPLVIFYCINICLYIRSFV